MDAPLRKTLEKNRDGNYTRDLWAVFNKSWKQNPYQYLYMTTYLLSNHHHHHITVLAQISLTLSRHPSLSSIQLTACIGTQLLYISSSWSSCLCSFLWGILRTTLLMSSSLLLQQCPGCLVPLIWMVFKMGARWPYSRCFVGCCRQDLFHTACCVLV